MSAGSPSCPVVNALTPDMPLRVALVAGPFGKAVAEAVAAERGVDQARVDLAKRLVVSAQPFVNTETKRTEEDVCAGDQPMEDRLAFRLLQVDRDAALISVGVVPGIGPSLTLRALPD